MNERPNIFIGCVTLARFIFTSCSISFENYIYLHKSPPFLCLGVKGEDGWGHATQASPKQQSQPFAWDLLPTP